MSLKTEIFEQPDVVENLLKSQMDAIIRIAKEIKKANVPYVHIAARGTSDNAGRYASYLWGAHNQMTVGLATPSLYSVYQQPPRLNGALVVGISQSGQSPDIVSVLHEARKQGCPTLAITNEKDSPLAKEADWVIDICAGEEKAVAATKTYTTELMVVAMLSAAMQDNFDQAFTELKKVPKWMKSVLKKDAEIEQIAQRYRFMDQCVVLGRGYNYATSFEWTIKLKELTYVVADGYSSADFRHGPIALVDRGFPVMVINPKGAVFEDMLTLVKKLREDHLAEVLVISNDQRALDLAQSAIAIPEDVPEWLSPLICIVPAQLFAYHLTEIKGYSTETPRWISKVTETK
ncbi:MAG: SIS domain-containing protein [Anaerolineaceae bacterium]|nr:SIS domain-containing protein [Anaerolineaceae bacterium]